MTMRAQFPRTSAAYPDLLDWDQPFDWAEIGSREQALRLVDAQSRFAHADQQQFTEYCEAVADDVSELAPLGEIGVVADTIDEFRFLFALLPMELTLAWGQNGDCYGWIMWTLARGSDRRGRVFDVHWSFFPADSQAAPDYRDIAMNNLPRWTAAFFLLAHKFGGLDVMAAATAPLCWQGCIDALPRGVGADECLAGLISLANWAVISAAPQAERWVQILADLWQNPLPERARAQLGILMITQAHRFTGRDSKSWARELLDNWRPLLTEHLLLQVLATSVRDYADWTERRDEIIKAASELALFYRATSPNAGSALQALESRVSILHPLVYFLTEHGTVEDLLDVLGVWYSPPDGRSCDGNVLIVAAAHRHGVGYLWPGGRLIVDRDAAATTFERMLATASLAQRDFHRVGNVGDLLPQIDLYRMGQPDETQAPAFEEAVRAHFEPERLNGALPQGLALRSVLTVPAIPVPVGALLASESNAPAAQEISLKQALPDREIRRIAIWPGSTLHAGFEAEALERVAVQAGWTLDVADVSDDPEAFIEFYERDEADLLWVIGHGEHSPYRIEQSGLVIGEGLVTAEALSRIPDRQDQRRLVVLNVCSGAATQVRGGIARIGLSQELITPSQQLIAHLWPIGMYTGLAFGAKLAMELAARPVEAAYRATICGMRNPRTLCEELSKRLGDDLGIHERLAGQHAQLGNILSWGAPVLLT